MVLDEEPVRGVDKIMMAMLEPLGVGKGIRSRPMSARRGS